MRCVLLLCVLGLILWAPGCGPKLPRTYPVKGKVLVEGGDVKKLAGALVEFESVADKSIRAYGSVNPDGTFEMSTQTAGAGLSGVVEGQHRVRITMVVERNEEEEEDDEGRPIRRRRAGPIPPRYQSFDTSGLTYTAPGDSEVTFKLAGKR